ncbi:two-component system sporulation sensor kinase B [Bacillus sp. SLBN-46]|uniref:ATP-binding protein n=1 Tax=Bacillus sp. SLBN-46 TaxID=3042283 RepID=UPI00286121AA|nr:ATP-binding protein [Bacillus sp. SLBN-46]MDR6125282.1 two-component system sporulation sensor kinase B [Bacillus sp. SLBN-46]
MITLIKPLIVNITILLSFTFNMNLFFPFQSKAPLSLKQKVIYGLVGALGALFCMIYPIRTLGETHFDLRMVAIIILTLYAGWLPGSIILVSTCLIRYFIGGKFLLTGILVCVVAFLCALALRRLFLKANSRLAVGSIVVGCYLVLYITILYFRVRFLELHFYLTYFIAFYLTTIALIFVIESLIKINKQFDEMVYMDKLTMVGQLTASIAHEIRNPLATVRGFIQFLSTDTKDEQLKKYSPLILEELDRTNNIITSYLKVAKPEPVQLTVVSLHDVLSDCVQLLRPLASYSNVIIDYESTQRFYINGDEPHLKQALMNVIKNAIESIVNQGKIKIELQADYMKNQVEVRIEDNGRGMTPEQLKHIGLPFYTTKTKGTGLGSMVTNKLIREMNGSIEYKSELNKGTTVTIVFPLRK